MKVLKEQLLLYAVTDSTWLAGRTLAACVEQALLGGATFVQLREKQASSAQRLTEAGELCKLCHRHGAVFVVNDDVETALAANADGVHVGQSDMEAGNARRLLGPNKILGVTAHNVEEALRAEAGGADYLGVGAAFVTGTKKDANPITHAEIAAITAAVKIPVVAIGGINAENMPQLNGCGLAGVAVVSGIFAAPDIQAAARQMKMLAGQL